MGMIAELNRACAELPDGMNPSTMRQQAIGRVMEGMADMLVEPVYVGDIDTALVHHMGRAAFATKDEWWQDDPQDYVRLDEQLDQHGGTEPIPVLLSSTRKGETGTYTIVETALVAANPDPLRFQSSAVHERNIKRDGFAGRIAVTSRTLLLLGDTTTIAADVTGGAVSRVPVIPSRPRIERSPEGFVVSQTSQIDGRNSKSIPLERDYGGSTVDIERFKIDQRALVGWEQIVPALTKGIHETTCSKRAEQTSLQYVLRLKEFFETSGQFEALCAHSPLMETIFEQATSLQATFDALRPASVSAQV